MYGCTVQSVRGENEQPAGSTLGEKMLESLDHHRHHPPWEAAIWAHTYTVPKAFGVVIVILSHFCKQVNTQSKSRLKIIKSKTWSVH